MILTYRYRLLPTRAQHARLQAALDHTRDLYNAALEERIGAYQKFRKSIAFFDQSKSLTELRSDPECRTYAHGMERWPLRRVDFAFRAFFARVKAKTAKAGYPRYRGKNWFSFGFCDMDGWKLDNARLRLKGVGAIRVSLHRPMPTRPKCLIVKKVGNHWFALLATEDCQIQEKHIGGAVGVDVGIAHLATLSTGEHIVNARHGARLAGRVRRAQCALARCKKGSQNRQKAKARLAALKAKEANARTTHLHQISADLARRFGTIVVEKLVLKDMVKSARGSMEKPGKNIAAKAGLNRSLHDAGFGRLKEMLRYKAERAGGKLIEVDPRHTSQTCSACGVTDARSRCSQSRFICTGCGYEANADVNAAVNIARLGGVTIPGALNLEAA